MSTIKNGQISLYCNLIKIIKGAGTSFQSPTVKQNHVRNVCHTAHQYLTECHFDSTQKLYGDVPDFEINGFLKNTKIQISRERNIFFQIIMLVTHQGLLCGKNSFEAEVNFKFYIEFQVQIQPILVYIIFHTTSSGQINFANYCNRYATQKISLMLRIFLVNVNKSVENCEFVQIY